MRALVLGAIATCACGRVGFDAVAVGSGDGGAGDASNDACMPAIDPPATHVVQSGDDLFALLPTLVAGDVIEVGAGTYASSGPVLVTWAGTQAQPIIVRAAAGARPVLQGVASQNVLDISGSWFTVRGFEVVSGDVGFRLHGPDHATFDDIKLHALGDEGLTCNSVGQPCTSLTLRKLEIFGTAGNGTAIALGCPDGSCSPTNTVVEGCFIHDLSGTIGLGIAADIGASALVIRDNVITRLPGPGIEVGGTLSGMPSTIERNVVWGTSVDNGIQIEGQVVVRNNIVVSTNGYGIYSNQKAMPPNDAQVVHNTVVGGAACFAVDNWDTTTGQLVANNAFYCSGKAAIQANTGAPAALFANNVIVGTSAATAGNIIGVSLTADLGANASSAQVYPPAGSALIDAGDPAHSTADDFNALPRDSTPDAGAYERSSDANPGWPVTVDFKPLPATGC